MRCCLPSHGKFSERKRLAVRLEQDDVHSATAIGIPATFLKVLNNRGGIRE